MSETCTACGHELPAGYVGDDGLCYLCQPLTDDELAIVAEYIDGKLKQYIPED